MTFDDSILIKFVRLTPPNGGRRPIFYSNLTKRLQKLRSVIQIKRALVVARAFVDNDPHYKSIRQPDPRSKNNLQTKLAEKLMQEASMQHYSGLCGIPELWKFQNILKPDYQVKVWSKEQMGNLVFEGPHASKVLHLFLHNNHYDVLKSPMAFFKRSYWCENCNKGYNNRTDHRCSNRCKYCYSWISCRVLKWVCCKKCHMNFPSEECYMNHKKVKPKCKKSICSLIKRCKECKVLPFGSRKKHVCGLYECTICKQLIDKKHSS